MRYSHRKSRVCNRCKARSIRDAEFCHSCGNPFVNGMRCMHHKKSDAAGVCVICCQPYCTSCVSIVNKRYLCRDHEEYEIYEGMARVYGVSDAAAASYVRDCLRKQGLHPFLYSRKASPISLGGAEYTLFRASGEYDGHIINEVKVMVPCGEVLESEQVLRELDMKVRQGSLSTKGG